MFLPIGDTPNPTRFRPWINWTLIGANLAVFVALTVPLMMGAADPGDPRLLAYMEAVRHRLPPGVSLHHLAESLSAWDLFVFEWGFRPGAPSVATLFTSMFMHGGVAHLFGNMLFLWIYGDNVEHRLGRLGYLLAYLVSGVAATLGFAWLAGDSLVPMVGASGAISGVLGLYFLMFPRNKVKMLVFLFPILMNVWLVPARIVLGIYVVIDNFLPLLGGAQTGVAYGAHLGGFFAGLGMAFVGERLDWRMPWKDPVAPARPRALPPAEAVRRARELDQAGHRVAAVRMLRSGLDRARGSDAAPLHLALAEVLLHEGEVPGAFQHAVKALESDPDPVTARRTRGLLQRMPLDPRLLKQLGIG